MQRNYQIHTKIRRQRYSVILNKLHNNVDHVTRDEIIWLNYD